MGKKGSVVRYTVEEYIENLDGASMTGSWATGSWERIHGDCKSGTGGQFKLMTMIASSGAYMAKVVEGAASVRVLTYEDEPSFDTIVADLKATLVENKAEKKK